MQFAPSKCIVLARDITSLTLDNETLPQQQNFDYLGINVSTNGISWEGTFAKRSKKCKERTMMLREIGYNLTGFPQSSSSQIYKSFIRPTLTYGLALEIHDPKWSSRYIQVEGFELQQCFSASQRSSRNALHKLLKVEPLETRINILNIKFMGKLHNSVDSSIPAVKLYWVRLQSGNGQSLVTLAKKNNPLWAKANLISHLSNRPRRGHSDPKKPLLKSVTEEIKQNSIVTLDADKTNVSGSLVYVPIEKHRHALQPGTIPKKKHRIAILRWLSGGICRHTKCKICDEELSRDHGLECAGANAFLNQTMGQLVEPN
jgi:hypothetical protein